jgi:hypothetical protein
VTGDDPEDPQSLDESQPAAYPPDDEDDGPLGVAADGGTTQALTRLLKLSPCLDLHRRAGETQDHALRGHLCFALDLAIRILAYLLLLAILGAVAWKTLAPLPDL